MEGEGISGVFIICEIDGVVDGFIQDKILFLASISKN